MQGKVSIREVHKAYGSYVALDRMSLDIRPGEFVTLLGPSGSGKTTLLNVLAGFVRPDRGSVQVDGEEFLTRPPNTRNLGMVFQNYALFPHMNVSENVAYPLRLRKVGAAERERRVRSALAMVRMEPFAGRRVQDLSGGQRQRVAMARAIVFEPRILLMDEPLSALDKNLRDHMQLELKRLHERLGTTTVYVTHDQREALTLSNRIAVINHGRLVQFDEPSAIYDRPADRFVAGFIGETSFVPVTMTASGPALYGRPLRTRTPWTGGTPNPSLVIRPERLRWRGAEDDGGNIIDGRIAGIVYQGDSHILTVRLPDGAELDIRRGFGDLHGTVPERGDAVRLWLDPENTILVAGEA